MRRIERARDAALALAALALSFRAALSVSVLGDYPGDGGPALRALMHGDLVAFAHAQPAMGALSLLVRAPFAAIAYIGNGAPSALAIYRWGCVPCTLSVAVLAIWLAQIARRRGAGALAAAAIVALALVNPLLDSALTLGHPEELMTASLCVGALVAACERRAVLAAVLLGLALACKQWALVIVLPVLFALERDRLRVLAGAAAVAIAVTIPEALGAPASFVRNQLTLAHNERPAPAILSWWWPLAPAHTLHVLVEGSYRSVREHRLPRGFVATLHPTIITLDALIAAAVARARGIQLRLRRDDVFALGAIVLLLRCTLDTETMPYYHEALFLDLLAWDALRGARVPLRALAAWVSSYVVFQSLSSAQLGASYSLLYAAVTLAALALLARTLLRRAPATARPLAGGIAAPA